MATTEFYSPIRYREEEASHTTENLLTSGFGSIGGAIATTATLALGPAGWAGVTGGAVLAGAIGGAIPGLMKEAYHQVEPPMYQQQYQSQIGRVDRRDMGPSSPMQGIAQYAEPAPSGDSWTPGFMTQMGRYV